MTNLPRRPPSLDVKVALQFGNSLNDDDDDKTPEYPLNEDHPLAILNKFRLDVLNQSRTALPSVSFQSNCDRKSVAGQKRPTDGCNGLADRSFIHQVTLDAQPKSSSVSNFQLTSKLSVHSNPFKLPNPFWPDTFVSATQFASLSFQALNLETNSDHDSINVKLKRHRKRRDYSYLVESLLDSSLANSLIHPTTKTVFNLEHNSICRHRKEIIASRTDNNNNASHRAAEPFDLIKEEPFDLIKEEPFDLDARPERFLPSLTDSSVQNSLHILVADAQSDDCDDDYNDSKSPPHLSPMDEDDFPNESQLGSPDLPLPPLLSPISKESGSSHSSNCRDNPSPLGGSSCDSLLESPTSETRDERLPVVKAQTPPPRPNTHDMDEMEVTQTSPTDESSTAKQNDRDVNHHHPSIQLGAKSLSKTRLLSFNKKSKTILEIIKREKKRKKNLRGGKGREKRVVSVGGHFFRILDGRWKWLPGKRVPISNKSGISGGCSKRIGRLSKGNESASSVRKIPRRKICFKTLEKTKCHKDIINRVIPPPNNRIESCNSLPIDEDNIGSQLVIATKTVEQSMDTETKQDTIIRSRENDSETLEHEKSRSQSDFEHRLEISEQIEVNNTEVCCSDVISNCTNSTQKSITSLIPSAKAIATSPPSCAADGSEISLNSGHSSRYLPTTATTPTHNTRPLIVTNGSTATSCREISSCVTSVISSPSSCPITTETRTSVLTSSPTVPKGHGMTVTSSPTVLHSNGITVSSSPTVLQSDSVTVTSSPTVLQSDGVTVTSSPTVLQSDGVTVTSSPTVLQSDSVTVTSSPTVLHSDSVTVTSSPTVLQSDGVTVTSSPTVLQSDSVTVTSSPTVLQSDGVIVMSSPTVLQSDSVTVTSSPTVLQSDGVTVTSSPTVLQSNGVTVTSSPTFLQSDSVTVTSSPTVLQSDDVTVTPSPPDLQNDGVTVTSSPTILQSDEVTVTSSSPDLQHDGVTVTSSLTVLQRDGVTVTSSPPDLQNDGVTVTSSPTVLQSDGVTVTSSPTVLQSDGVTVTSLPTVLQSDGVTVTSSPPDLRNNGLIVTSSPTVLQSDGVAVTSSPTVLQHDGVTVTSSPTVLQRDGVTVTSSPPDLQNDGVTVTSSPTVLQSDGVAVTSSPTVLQSDGVTVTSLPTVVQSDGVAVTSSATVLQSDGVTVTSYPPDLQNDGVTLTSSPTVLQREGVTVTSSASGGNPGTSSDMENDQKLNKDNPFSRKSPLISRTTLDRQTSGKYHPYISCQSRGINTTSATSTMSLPYPQLTMSTSLTVVGNKMTPRCYPYILSKATRKDIGIQLGKTSPGHQIILPSNEDNRIHINSPSNTPESPMSALVLTSTPKSEILFQTENSKSNLSNVDNTWKHSEPSGRPLCTSPSRVTASIVPISSTLSSSSSSSLSYTTEVLSHKAPPITSPSPLGPSCSPTPSEMARPEKIPTTSPGTKSPSPESLSRIEVFHNAFPSEDISLTEHDNMVDSGRDNDPHTESQNTDLLQESKMSPELSCVLELSTKGSRTIPSPAHDFGPSRVHDITSSSNSIVSNSSFQHCKPIPAQILSGSPPTSHRPPSPQFVDDDVIDVTSPQSDDTNFICVMSPQSVDDDVIEVTSPPRSPSRCLSPFSTANNVSSSSAKAEIAYSIAVTEDTSLSSPPLWRASETVPRSVDNRFTSVTSSSLSRLSPSEDEELFSFMATVLNPKQAPNSSHQTTTNHAGTTLDAQNNEEAQMGSYRVGVKSVPGNESLYTIFNNPETDLPVKNESPVFINERAILNIEDNGSDTSGDESSSTLSNTNSQAIGLPLKDFFTTVPAEKSYSSLAIEKINHKNRKLVERSTSRRNSESEDVLKFLAKDDLPDGTTDKATGNGAARNTLRLGEVIDLTDTVSISSDEELDEVIDVDPTPDIRECEVVLCPSPINVETSGGDLETVQSKPKEDTTKVVDLSTECDVGVHNRRPDLENPIVSNSPTDEKSLAERIKIHALKMSEEKRAALSAKIQSIIVKNSELFPDSFRKNILFSDKSKSVRKQANKRDSDSDDVTIVNRDETDDVKSVIAVDRVTSPDMVEVTRHDGSNTTPSPGALSLDISVAANETVSTSTPVATGPVQSRGRSLSSKPVAEVYRTVWRSSFDDAFGSNNADTSLKGRHSRTELNVNVASTTPTGVERVKKDDQIFQKLELLKLAGKVVSPRVTSPSKPFDFKRVHPVLQPSQTLNEGEQLPFDASKRCPPTKEGESCQPMDLSMPHLDKNAECEKEQPVGNDYGNYVHKKILASQPKYYNANATSPSTIHTNSITTASVAKIQQTASPFGIREPQPLPLTSSNPDSAPQSIPPLKKRIGCRAIERNTDKLPPRQQPDDVKNDLQPSKSFFTERLQPIPVSGTDRPPPPLRPDYIPPPPCSYAPSSLATLERMTTHSFPPSHPPTSTHTNRPPIAAHSNPKAPLLPPNAVCVRPQPNFNLDNRRTQNIQHPQIQHQNPNNNVRSLHQVPNNVQIAQQVPNNVQIAHQVPNNVHIAHQNLKNPRIAHQVPNNVQIAHQVPDNVQIAHQVPNNVQIAHQVPNSVNIAHQVPKNVQIAHQNPNNSQVANQVPENVQIAHQNPNNAQISHQNPNNTQIVYKNPNTAQIPHQNTSNVHSLHQNPNNVQIAHRNLNNAQIASINFHIAQQNPNNAQIPPQNPNSSQIAHHNQNNVQIPFQNPKHIQMLQALNPKFGNGNGNLNQYQNGNGRVPIPIGLLGLPPSSTMHSLTQPSNVSLQQNANFHNSYPSPLNTSSMARVPTPSESPLVTNQQLNNYFIPRGCVPFAPMLLNSPFPAPALPPQTSHFVPNPLSPFRPVPSTKKSGLPTPQQFMPNANFPVTRAPYYPFRLPIGSQLGHLPYPPLMSVVDSLKLMPPVSQFQPPPPPPPHYSSALIMNHELLSRQAIPNPENLTSKPEQANTRREPVSVTPSRPPLSNSFQNYKTTEAIGGISEVYSLAGLQHNAAPSHGTTLEHGAGLTYPAASNDRTENNNDVNPSPAEENKTPKSRKRTSRKKEPGEPAPKRKRKPKPTAAAAAEIQSEEFELPKETPLSIDSSVPPVNTPQVPESGVDPVGMRSDSGFSDSGIAVDQMPELALGKDYVVKGYEENGISFVSLKPLGNESERNCDSTGYPPLEDATSLLEQHLVSPVDKNGNLALNRIGHSSRPCSNDNRGLKQTQSEVKEKSSNGLSSLILASQEVERDFLLHDKASPARDRSYSQSDRKRIDSPHHWRSCGNSNEMTPRRPRRRNGGFTEKETQVASMLASMLQHGPIHDGRKVSKE